VSGNYLGRMRVALRGSSGAPQLTIGLGTPPRGYQRGQRTQNHIGLITKELEQKM
jgi:hypothetical protein